LRTPCSWTERAREVARTHGLSKSWIYELIRRYRAGGSEALEPRSRRPRCCRRQTSAQTVKAIVQLRSELQTQGHDAGAETIAYHLAQTHEQIPSVSTIWRILRREGLVVSEPRKRPRSSLIRFEARLPNECWQADITAWQLASGEVVDPYFRVREDKVDKAGKVSLRYDSRLYKIGLGRAHKGRVVKLLIADQDIRVIDANGQLIRELTLDPSRIYQPISQGLVSPMS
jgi:transposase